MHWGFAHGPALTTTFPLSGAPSPVSVVLHILREAKASQQIAARHTMRLIPVTHTCYVSMEDVQQLAAKIAQESFPAGEAPWWAKG
jgi:type III secretory pathway component EscR